MCVCVCHDFHSASDSRESSTDDRHEQDTLHIDDPEAVLESSRRRRERSATTKFSLLGSDTEIPTHIRAVAEEASPSPFEIARALKPPAKQPRSRKPRHHTNLRLRIRDAWLAASDVPCHVLADPY